MGIVISDSELDSDTDTVFHQLPILVNVYNSTPYDWFEVVQYVEEQTKCDYETVKLQEYLNGFYSHVLETLNDMPNINLLKPF